MPCLIPSECFLFDDWSSNLYFRTDSLISCSQYELNLDAECLIRGRGSEVEGQANRPLCLSSCYISRFRIAMTVNANRVQRNSIFLATCLSIICLSDHDKVTHVELVIRDQLAVAATALAIIYHKYNLHTYAIFYRKNKFINHFK